MVIRTRLLLVLVTLMVCSLVVAGCTSVNANKDQKIVTTTTSTNNDQKFIETVQSAGADLNPIIDDIGPAMSAKDYLTVQTLGTKLSTRAQFWYDKISPMPVSSQYQDQKSAYLQALLNKKATGDQWATEAQNGGNVTTTSPTYQSTYQQTVAVQTTLQNANDDIKFLITGRDAMHELGPIITAIGAAINSNDLSTAKTLGAKLSTRSQYWYNEVAPLSVSSKYQESKEAFVIVISELKAGGDAAIEMMQLKQDGKVSASHDKGDEALRHLNKATIYLNLMGGELPT